MQPIPDWCERTLLQIGKEKLLKIQNAHVLVVGLGGVGSYTAEMLCRAGIGGLTIVDGDIIQVSNLNRQLPALNSTLGHKKAKVMASRLSDINPAIKLHVIDEYIKDDKMEHIVKQPYDYVVDAIDTLSPKVYLIYHALNHKLPLVSSMGAGGKYNPMLVKISDIAESYNCKFARIVRKRLHKLGISTGFKVVFSPEEVNEAATMPIHNELNKRTIVGTISYMPAIFGCYCASVVITDLIS